VLMTLCVGAQRHQQRCRRQRTDEHLNTPVKMAEPCGAANLLRHSMEVLP
jgi:hypothetical protein